jgi:hypothetical protein
MRGDWRKVWMDVLKSSLVVFYEAVVCKAVMSLIVCSVCHLLYVSIAQVELILMEYNDWVHE